MASWIFQGNPEIFDIDAYLNNHKIIWWAINQKQFVRKMNVGDEAYLWRSNSHKHSSGGIVGHGILIGRPEVFTSDEMRQYFFEKKRGEAKLRVQISMDSVQLEPPKISRDFLKSDPLLSKLQILRFANATNFELNKAQAQRLSELYFGMEGSLESTGESDVSEFPEGHAAYVLHRKRERSASLIQQAKTSAIKKFGSLYCQVCGFDFSLNYGRIGEGYIEAHHTIPVSELNENSVTRVQDIALVCSNCHRMLHRRRPWLSINELTTLLSQKRG
ncbi:MAG: EVE domain-containing protein [Thermodesulfovibrionales bacterium]|nr:EVE domain-containing protein [Thermodesulfovibrionales bacterium]